MKKLSLVFSLVLVLSMAFSSVLYAQETTEKKKWSPVAKGAVIGAGTGAAAGALINKKNRVAGGIVGGAVGGAVGAGVGKIIDNKQKKKAAEEQQRMAQLEQVAANNAASNAGARSYASSGQKTSSRVKTGTSKVAAPAAEVAAVQPAYMQMGWIPNNDVADPNVAYSNSEFKRKSW